MIHQDSARTSRHHRTHQSPTRVLINPFRVQIQDSETASWRMYASFEFEGEAEACLDLLTQRGIETRLISNEVTCAVS